MKAIWVLLGKLVDQQNNQHKRIHNWFSVDKQKKRKFSARKIQFIQRWLNGFILMFSILYAKYSCNIFPKYSISLFSPHHAWKANQELNNWSCIHTFLSIIKKVLNYVYTIRYWQMLPQLLIIHCYQHYNYVFY